MGRIWNALVAAAYNAMNNSTYAPMFALMDIVFRYLFGTAPALFVDVVTTSALGYTYANGSSGVGATLTKGSAGAFPTTDGVAPYVGMLVLVTGEATKARNGYFRLNRLGDATVAAQLTRVTAWDTSAEMLAGSVFYVKQGTSYGGTIWTYTGASAPTVGTTALTFAETSLASLVSSSGGGAVNAWEDVRLASTGNVNIASAPATLDGVALVASDRVLLKDQSSALQNGIYVFSAAAAALVRADDANNSAQWIDSKRVVVREGTQEDTVWYFDPAALPFVLDTDDAPFERESGVLLSAVSQTVTAAKKFATLTLQVLNGAGTFVTRFASNATADRTVTWPDADLTPAQSGVATVAEGTGAVTGSTAAEGTGVTGGTAPGLTDAGHNHTQDAHLHAVTDPGHDHGAATGAEGTGAVTGSTGAEGTGATGSTAPGLTDPTHDHGGATGSGTASITVGGNTASGTTGISVNEAAPQSKIEVSEAPATAGVALFAQQATDFDIASAGITQPDYPRNVQVVFSAGWDGGNVEVTGLRMDGTVASEEVTSTPGSTVESAHGYANVTRVRNLGTRLAGTVDVQTGPKLGILVGSRTVAAVAILDKAAGAIAGASISANGLVDLNASPPNGARGYRIAYTLAETYNVTDTGHTHAATGLTGTDAGHTHSIAAGATGATVDAHTHTGPSHTHAAGTLAGPSHTHAIAADTTGATVDNATATNQAAVTGATVDSHTHTGPSHTHAAGTLAGPSHTHDQV